MFERIKKERQQEREGGFTLIELLVVIAILGILAAIVVFSVAGINDKGQLAACKIDTQTLQTAEEANFAKFSKYDTMSNVQANGFLSTVSTLHNVVLTQATTTGGAGGTPTAASYYVVESGATPTCGVATNDSVGTPPPGYNTAPNPTATVPTTPCGTGAANPSGIQGDC